MTDPILYLPQVAWETMVKNVRMITDWTYYITVSPDNLNDVGAGTKEVGFYFIDNNGEQYSITAINVNGVATDIEVTDSLKCGFGPVSDRTGIVYKSVGDGLSPFLAPVMYQRLDSTAQDKGREIDLAVNWKHRGIAIGTDVNITKLEVENIEATVNSDPTLGWLGGLKLKLKNLFTTFLSLTDTPSSYAGQALKTLRVKADVSGIEFVDPPLPFPGFGATHILAAYGDHNHTGVYLPLTGGTLSGPLSGTSASFSNAVAAESLKLGATVEGYVLKIHADGTVFTGSPTSGEIYNGAWDASTNTPTLTNGTGTTGSYYHCTVSGTVNFGAGNIVFTAYADDVAYNGTIWQRIPQAQYSPVIASATSLGVVKIGSGVTVDANGIISVSTAYDATGTATGIMSAHTTAYNHANIANGQTAFGWNNHALAGYGLASSLTAHEALTTTAHGLGASAFHADNFFELAFAKNTAFNKNFGITAGTVLEGRTFGSAANSNLGDYIQNQNVSAQTANMWISGTGTFAGNIIIEGGSGRGYKVTGAGTMATRAFLGMDGLNFPYLSIINPDTYNETVRINHLGAATFSGPVTATVGNLTGLSVIKYAVGRVANFATHSDLVAEGTEDWISIGYTDFHLGNHYSGSGNYGYLGIGTNQTLKIYSNDNAIFSGPLSASNLSGSNTGDNASNSLYSGLVSNATHIGDATGATILTLATVNANVGTYNNVTINAKGLATAGSNISYLTGITLTNVTTALGFIPYNSTNPNGYTNYSHPANHLPSIITQDVNNRFVTDTEKSTWDGKQAAITGLTTNYQSKWGGSGLVNSSIFDNGNIGIGTIITNPTVYGAGFTTLHISGYGVDKFAQFILSGNRAAGGNQAGCLRFWDNVLNKETANITVANGTYSDDGNIYFNVANHGVLAEALLISKDKNATFSGIIAAASLDIKGTSGAGFIKLIGQSLNPASPPAGTLLLHSSTANGFTRMEQDNEAATNLIYSRDNVFIAKNTSGAIITKGSVVYVTGSTGNVPNIAKAMANSTTTLPSVGIVVDDMPINAFGQIMTMGIISNFNTSAFAIGAPVWVSPAVAGGLTSVRPSGITNSVQRVGSILVSGVGNGSLLINIAPAVLNMETGTNAPAWTGSAITGTIITATGGNSTQWNAKEVPLTFSTGLTRTGNVITNNITQYTHPANHPPSIITQDASNRFVTDAEKSTWNAKQVAGSYLTSETDPVFTAWNMSTGISITKSQITDLPADIVTAAADTFTSTPKALSLVTLTQVEYDAIATKNTNTLYIIT